MTLAASTAQIGQQPVSMSSTQAGAVASDTLSSAATTGPVRTANAEKILFTPSLFGTLTNDCTLAIEVSVNGTNFSPLSGASWTNAELQANNAKLIELTAGVSFRPRLTPGGMTGSNGITLRHKN